MPQAIDVFQKYQGSINWAQVAGTGITQVFVKLTNGSSKASPSGDNYVAGAHGAHLLVGGYAYALGSSTPAAQADVFAAELLRLKALDLAPALDFEDLSLPGTAASRRAWATTFFTELKKKIPGLAKGLIYSSATELVAMDVALVRNAVPGLAILPWDAEYSVNDGKEHPRTHFTGEAAGHQYTSEGTVAGVPTKVDRTNFTADITHPVNTTATPVEDDLQFTDKIPTDNKPGTVGFFMADWLRGYAGSNPAGAMAMDVMNIASTVNGLTAAVKTLSGLLAAQHTGLTADDVYSAVTKALTDNTVKVDVSVQGTTNPST